MSVPELLLIAAALCLAGAAVYAAVHKAWIAMLVCAAELRAQADAIPAIT